MLRLKPLSLKHFSDTYFLSPVKGVSCQNRLPALNSKYEHEWLRCLLDKAFALSVQFSRFGTVMPFTMAPWCGSSGPVNVDFLDGSIVRAGQKVYIMPQLPGVVRSSLDWLYFLISSYALALS